MLSRLRDWVVEEGGWDVLHIVISSRCVAVEILFKFGKRMMRICIPRRTEMGAAFSELLLRQAY